MTLELWQEIKDRRGSDSVGPEKLLKTYVAWQCYEKGTPNRGFWDQQMLEDVFSRQMWNPVNGHEYEHVNSISDVPRNVDGAIVVLHARSCAHERWAHKLNDDIQRFKWAIVMLVSDEESSFPAFQVKHRNMKLYIMMPNERRHSSFLSFGLPNGYPTDTQKHLSGFKTEQLEKKLDWFFSGQDTNQRRHVFVEYAQAVGGMPTEEFGTGGVLIKTDGFTKGLPREEYYRLMAKAKIIPCPSGAVAPDSFRLYEALEAGCVPLADNYYAWEDYTQSKSYWTFMLGEVPPFPTVDEWRMFPKMLLDALSGWPANANRIGAWWLQYKRRFVYQIENDVNALRGAVERTPTLKDKITVLISSSPIPSHPSIAVIKETIASVRAHLPESEIIIMQDGIRPEQKDWSERYEAYKFELLHFIRNECKNVMPIFFDEFYHQAEMTRRALDYVKTPHVLFVEHDTPLCDDLPIEWDGIVRAIESGFTDSVRLHHLDVGFIHQEHMHLMIDKVPEEVAGVRLMRTNQYSQRPHVATVDHYRRLLSNFSPDCRTFIEDLAYLLCSKDPDGRTYRMSVYTPHGHIKRSRDLNGRAGGPKYDDKLVF